MQPEPLRTFAENVRRLRQARGLSQTQLAELAGLNMTDISRIEKRKREPGLRVLVKVARGLSVPIGELFDGIETVAGDPRAGEPPETRRQGSRRRP